jgi:hypothetical protein
LLRRWQGRPSDALRLRQYVNAELVASKTTDRSHTARQLTLTRTVVQQGGPSQYLDVAVRDLVMACAAFALAELSPIEAVHAPKSEVSARKVPI